MRSACARCASCMALSCPAKPMGTPNEDCGGGGIGVAVLGDAGQRFSGDAKREAMLRSGVVAEVVDAEAFDIVSE
jgi:hypothetical protein